MGREVKVSNVVDLEEFEARWVESLEVKEVELIDGIVKDTSKLKWLDKEANDFMLRRGCKKDFNDKMIFYDIDSLIDYYSKKRVAYYTKEDGTKVEVRNTVLSLDNDNSTTYGGYNVATDVSVDDAYSISEDKLMAVMLIDKFVSVQEALIKEDSRRTPLIHLIRAYITADNSKKRYKAKQRLKDTLSLTVNDVNVGKLVEEMLLNKVTKGYLLDKDFNLFEYLEALDIE